MSERVYINEINPYKVQWLRNLAAAGLIPTDTVIDTRSIEDVRPDDVRGFDRCHFFGGIGGWSLALTWAQWPREAGIVWTCGCPCQPFSAAGKGAGFADERHLWPAQHWLVDQCRPDVLLGEQVASSDALTWLDLVQADMEASGYSGGSTDLCIAGFGGPQIRQRQWLTFERVADARSTPQERHGRHGGEGILVEATEGLGRGGVAGRLVQGGVSSGLLLEEGLADTDRQQHARSTPAGDVSGGRHKEPATSAGFHGIGGAGPVNGVWGTADWVLCNDPDGPTWRPVEPGTFPLANGVPGRVGRLRAYGETISPVVAQAVAEAYLEVRGFR